MHNQLKKEITWRSVVNDIFMQGQGLPKKAVTLTGLVLVFVSQLEAEQT